jgi:hypothetical protein
MQLIRLDTPEGRFYHPISGVYSPTGVLQLYPSVTTVLKAVPIPKLAELELALGKEVLNQLSDWGGRRGSVMHQYLENYFICLQKTNNPEQCLLYTQKKTLQDLSQMATDDKALRVGRDLFYNYYYEGYLERVSKIFFTEKFIWSNQHQYAGTLDFACVNTHGQRVIVDFKSANSTKDEATIHKYFLQGAAYSIAFEEHYHQSIDQIEIWVSSKSGIEEYVLNGAELTQKRKEYIHWVEDYHQKWQPQDIISKYYKSQ